MPKDRVRLLRKSFLDTLKDPEYVAEARKTSLTIDPVTGEEIEEIVSGLFKLDAAMVAKLKTVLVHRRVVARFPAKPRRKFYSKRRPWWLVSVHQCITVLIDILRCFDGRC